MATLSFVGAGLLRKYKASACTDVTGFGILGHATYLAQAQRANVEFVINKLPIYKGLIKIEKKVLDFTFLQGYAAETSGTLFICIGQDRKRQMMDELSANRINNWEIGYVREGSKTAVLEKAEVL